MSEIKVRSSYLSHFFDCPKRTLVKIFPEIKEEYNFIEPPRSIGSVIGSGVHKGIAYALNYKDSQYEPKISDIIECSVNEVEEIVKNKVLWDAITPNINAGTGQIEKIDHTFYNQSYRKLNPLRIEHSYSGKISLNSAKINLSGTPDLINKGKGVDIIDFKTGVALANYQSQLGAYSLLYQTNEKVKPEKLMLEFYPRVRKTKEVEPSFIEYDRIFSEKNAYGTLIEISRLYDLFTAEKDPDYIPANPQSKLCSPKYCPCFGTDFCKVSKIKRINESNR